MLKRWDIIKEWDEYVLWMSVEVMALINFVLWMCEDENEKETMLKRMYEVLYNK